MTIVEDTRVVTGGVDTHADMHVAAALDPIGGLLGVREFPATAAGYAGLLDRLRRFTDRPGRRRGNRKTGRAWQAPGRGWRPRRGSGPAGPARPARQGESDPLDAVSAARAAQSGRASGRREAAMARWRRSGRCGGKRSARRERTQAIDQARALVAAGPAVGPVRRARPAALAAAIARSARPGDVPGYATGRAVRAGRRVQFLDAQLERLGELIGPWSRLRAGPAALARR